MEALIQVVGWFGALMVVGAYFLVSSKKVQGHSKLYQWLNLVGAIGIGVNVLHQKAWPSLVLQIAWGIIAIFALLKIQKKPKS